ncbi:hypothetical protein GE061_012947 [Apolygus lucorum]|uniref:Uncharacterized protein n=1 Tax=Apolygus lucorum TaxID=248454 RepID=A0A8S9XUX8_APOLU|nr:hypothetical protein GE061_012947 [Apolygus lucorum]
MISCPGQMVEAMVHKSLENQLLLPAQKDTPTLVRKGNLILVQKGNLIQRNLIQAQRIPNRVLTPRRQEVLNHRTMSKKNMQYIFLRMGLPILLCLFISLLALERNAKSLKNRKLLQINEEVLPRNLHRRWEVRRPLNLKNRHRLVLEERRLLSINPVSDYLVLFIAVFKEQERNVHPVRFPAKARVKGVIVNLQAKVNIPVRVRRGLLVLVEAVKVKRRVVAHPRVWEGIVLKVQLETALKVRVEAVLKVGVREKVARSRKLKSVKKFRLGMPLLFKRLRNLISQWWYCQSKIVWNQLPKFQPQFHNYQYHILMKPPPTVSFLIRTKKPPKPYDPSSFEERKPRKSLQVVLHEQFCTPRVISYILGAVIVSIIVIVVVCSG